MEEGGGYNLKFLDELDAEFVCSVCYYVLKDPVMPEICGHVVCSSCQLNTQAAM